MIITDYKNICIEYFLNYSYIKNMLSKGEFDLIKKYVNGFATEKEKQKVESIFSEGEENAELYKILEQDWNQTSCKTTANQQDMDRLLYKIHHEIRLRDKSKHDKPLNRVLRIYSKIAAIILLPLLLTGGIVFSVIKSKQYVSESPQIADNTIYAPLGSRVSFRLPDGTTGMLNSGSTLTYSFPFTTKRNLTLVGEGWFDVAHDENHPFKINTLNSSLKVLGTSFNVSSYPDENYVEIVLEEGQVEFRDVIDNKKVMLHPSERLVFEDGIIKTSPANPLKYNAWTEGKLIFRDEPMNEVARRIERWYNVKVVLADKKLEKYSFHATFIDDNLDDVMYCLSLTSPIAYSIKKQELLPDSSYSKAIVTIFLK